MIKVGIAVESDTDRLVEFIEEHWSATHIFAHRPEVFTWQHAQGDGRLNMIFAEAVDTDSPGVVAVLGFIPMGRFDPSLGDSDLMLAIWKVRETGVPPGLGLRLLKVLQRELAPRMIAAIGTSQQVRPIYEVLGYQVGSLHHSALFGPHCESDSTHIATGVPPEACASRPASDCDVSFEGLGADAVADVTDEIRAKVDAIASDRLPAKSWDYIVERYLQHPWYDYDVRQVLVDGELVAVVVWRAVSAQGSRLLRIVDIIGDTDWLRHGAAELQQATAQADAEYIDLVQWGVDAEVLADGGFISVDDHADLVLPNYFAPFEARNIEIELAFKVLEGDLPVQLFRADSDQDRPNVIAELDSTP